MFSLPLRKLRDIKGSNYLEYLPKASEGCGKELGTGFICSVALLMCFGCSLPPLLSVCLSLSHCACAHTYLQRPEVDICVFLSHCLVSF